MKKRDDQRDFEKMIQSKNEKLIKRVMTNIFTNPKESLDFINAVVKVASNLYPQNQVRRKELIQLIKSIRQKFVLLPLKTARNVLLTYYNEYFSKMKMGVAPRYAFDINNVLGGSGIGEISHAKKVMGIALSFARENPIPSEGEEQTKYCTGLAFLLGIISLTNIVHTWQNCIEAFCQGDSEAERIISDVLRIFTFLGNNSISLVPSDVWNTEFDLMWGCPDIAFETVVNEYDVRLPVPPTCIFGMRRLLKNLYSKIASEQKGVHEIVDWFKANLETLKAAFAQMWHDIVNHPKYDVRLEGHDRVTMNISGLKSGMFAYKELQFIREEYDFPQVGVKYWLEFEGKLCKLNITLRSGILENYYRVSDGIEYDDDRTTVDMILAYIAMHCYWRIVTGKKNCIKGTFRVPMPRTVVHNNSSSDKSICQAYTLIRPKFRRLPEGQKASDQAKERALEVFGRLPNLGFTFVKEHEKGIYLAQVQSIKPIFAYSNADLGC